MTLLHWGKKFTVDGMSSPFLNRDEKVPLHDSELSKRGEIEVEQRFFCPQWVWVEI